jgi:general secretion pathway protein L
MVFTDVLESFRRSSPGLALTFGDVIDAWRRQLGACLPRSLRILLLGRDQRLLVVPRDGEAGLYMAEDDVRHPLGDFALDADDFMPQLPPGFAGHAHSTVIELPADQVLYRSLSFPAQVRDNLQQVIRYEVDRLSPFQADQVFFDIRLNGTSRRGDRILVDLALCRRDRAEPWLQRLRESGSAADQLTWDGAWPKANLLPPAERPRRHGNGWKLTGALLLLALTLGTATLITPLWQRGQLLESLRAELNSVRTAAGNVEKVRAELERAREGSVAALQRKADQPRMIDLLRELTVRLPDGTWIQNLNFDKGEVQLRGESAHATALIALLEKSEGVRDVSFGSPVTQVAQTGAERFNIAFQYARPKPP